MQLYRQKSLKASHQPAKAGDPRPCVIEDIMTLVCHVILLDHVIQESRQILDSSASR